MRNKEKKTREITNKKGKNEIETYTEVEPFDDFYARTEKTLNDLANEGWQVINANYLLPTHGKVDFSTHGITWYGFSVSDFDSAEFVVMLQREKRKT